MKPQWKPPYDTLLDYYAYLNTNEDPKFHVEYKFMIKMYGDNVLKQGLGDEK